MIAFDHCKSTVNYNYHPIVSLTSATRSIGFIRLVDQVQSSRLIDPTDPWLTYGPRSMVLPPSEDCSNASVSHVGSYNTLKKLAFQKMCCFEIGFHKCLLFTLFQHTACDNCDKLNTLSNLPSHGIITQD